MLPYRAFRGPYAALSGASAADERDWFKAGSKKCPQVVLHVKTVGSDSGEGRV